MAKNIYDYCNDEKTNYESGIGIPIASGWMWSMYVHNNYSMLMKNGQFPVTQMNLGELPSKNIILPILNVAHRTEGFDVKDIEFYVNNADNFHLSFLARKFHANWALENNMDTFIDEVVEGLDYGFVLVKNVNDRRPEVVQPQQIAFVEQSDILSGAIGIKHQYSIDQLKAMEKQGWYGDKIDEVIKQAEASKDNPQSSGKAQKTTNKSIEVYEVEGTFPETWLNKEGDETYNENLNADKYCLQSHIITYYKDQQSKKQGVCLYKGKRKKTIFKVLITNPIFGRAAGRGRVEELFESQIWLNFDMIHMTNMLKEASKVIHITDDPGFTTRNNTKNLQGGEFLTLDDGKTATQLNTQPVNFQLFDRAMQEWEQHARTTGSASDPALGLNPVSGTPLGTTQTVVMQGEGIHEYRRGKIATFIAEIYRDWIMDYLVADMNKGLEWVDDLSLEDMQKLSEDVMTNEFNRYIKEKILAGMTVTEEELEPLREIFKKDFSKSSKKFLKIAKDEFADLPMLVKVNVAGKQKDLGRLADKLTNIWRSIFMNPQGFIATMAIPGASKAFNEMLEASGLSQMDFSNMPKPQEMQPEAQPQQQPLPTNQLTL
jgi:hypothetical protein